MRTLLSGFIGLGLLLTAAVSSHSQKADSKAMKAAVDEYMHADTHVPRREELRATLARGKQSDVVAHLKPWFRQEGSVARALELGLSLHLRGLFSTIESCFDSHAERVALLGVIANDKGAVKKLVQWWNERGPESKSFAALQKAFTMTGFDVEHLAEFRRVATDKSAAPEKQAAALEVLSFQLGEDFSDLEGMEAAWESLQKTLKDDGRRFSTSGLECFAFKEWNAGGARRLGCNWRVPKGAVLQSTAPFDELMGQGPYTVSLWVKPLQANLKADFWLQGTAEGQNTGLTFQCEGGNWILETTNGLKKLPLKANSWVQVQWQITTKRNAPATELYGAVLVDGKVLDSGFPVELVPNGLRLLAMEGDMVVAGADYVRN